MRRNVLIAMCLVVLAGAGCLEFQALLQPAAPGEDGTATPPPATVDDSDGETAYGPFRPGDSDGDTDSPDDDGTDNGSSDGDGDGDGTDDGDGDDGDGDEDTLVPLPDGAEVETLASGLQYYDFEVGTGEMPPTPSSSVRVDYAGFIQDTGRQFDKGQGVVFQLTNVIEGFAEGILGMRVGGKRRIIIPPDLGYGSGGNPGAGIGGDDVIVFDVSLLSIE